MDRAASSDRHAAAFRHAPMGLGLLDAAGVLLEANSALAEALGQAGRDSVGRRLIDHLHRADRQRAVAAFRRVAAGAVKSAREEFRVVHPDGAVRWVLGAVAPAGDRGRYVVQLVDITERKELEERLAHQALHDPLTGLPNRVLFLDRLDYALALLHRSPGMVAVLFLDLDGFKAVNDSLGHVRGDELLVEIAVRLQRTVRTTDPLARFGGDEFALLVRDLQAVDSAVELAERMVEAIAPPVRLADTEVQVTASVGIATTRGGADRAELLRRADLAMYRAKNRPDRHWAIAPPSER